MNKFGKEYQQTRYIENKHYKIMNYLLLLAPNIRTAYDYGCGMGFYVHCLKYYGVEAEGFEIDQYCADNAYLLSAGFISTTLTDKKYDLVLSMDVLEHLKDMEVKDYIDNCFKFTNKYIFVSVCSAEVWERFKDDTHITKRPLDYWRHEFEKRGGRIIDLPEDFSTEKYHAKYLMFLVEVNK